MWFRSWIYNWWKFKGVSVDFYLYGRNFWTMNRVPWNKVREVKTWTHILVDSNVDIETVKWRFDENQSLTKTLLMGKLLKTLLFYEILLHVWSNGELCLEIKFGKEIHLHKQTIGFVLRWILKLQSGEIDG